MTVRKSIFWVHLITGILAGLMIAIMSATGTILAFEKEIVSWSERDARRVDVPAERPASALPLDEQIARAQAASASNAQPSSIIVSSRPDSATTVSFGRDRTYYVNPYTGEARQPASTAVHDFMHVMEDWHRWLAMSGENRATGKLLNGSANLCFFLLAVTGLYIWLPKRRNWQAFRSGLWFRRGLSSKARDWSWHNVIGFWSSPVLIVLTLTALPISFRWASNGLYQAFGETPPTRQGPGSTPAVQVPAPAPGTSKVPLDALVASVAQQNPRWESITFRLAAPGGPRGADAPAGAARPQTADQSVRDRTAAAGGGGSGGETTSIPAINVLVRSADQWPLFSSTTHSLNPYTGEVVRTETFEDATSARQFRSWTRFLHTGEAFGWPGKLVAGLASLGGVFLVYTGFALSWRRFFGRRGKDEPVRGEAKIKNRDTEPVERA